MFRILKPIYQKMVMVYITTLSVNPTLQRRIIGWLTKSLMNWKGCIRSWPTLSVYPSSCLELNSVYIRIGFFLKNKSGPRYRYTNLLSEQQEGRISVTFCIVIQSLYSLACRSLWQRQRTYVRFAANAIPSLVKAQHLFNLLSLPSAVLRTYLVLKHCISKWLSPRFTDAISVFLVC